MSLNWTLATTGYEFSKEHYKFAIIIKTNPNDEFNTAVVTGNGQSLSLKFKHGAGSRGKQYAYALSVRPAGGTAFCEWVDPWLIS